ncbi:hypothetical protein RvY_06497 [Ramazzottius varieornatus]|uniref:DDE-1 domain-containing protein n=1 Tax=Ramazzottius varieornatus TaxID=947166 RepID=A0A1D1V1R0_RAMVA|nr:hypothetical protein RvY_06497 [Ramazzottius varieornatus]
MAVSPGNRKFLPVLFITLQEDKGVFGPIVSKALFKARNLHVTASKSGQMTKELYIEWCEKVFFPQMNGHCFFLADSWKTFADHDAVEEVKPEKLEYEMITIPPKDGGWGNRTPRAQKYFFDDTGFPVFPPAVGSHHELPLPSGTRL